MKIIVLTIFALGSFTAIASELEPCKGQNRSEIEIIEYEAPSYPSDTFYDGNGKVIIQLYVDKRGNIVERAIKTSTPARLFDRSALRALERSVFSKSKKDKVRCGIISYDFALE